MCAIFLVGLFVIPFAPETRGQAVAGVRQLAARQAASVATPRRATHEKVRSPNHRRLRRAVPRRIASRNR